jgi:hypothetical protein
MQRGFLMREQQSRDYPIPENMRLQNAFWASEHATWIVLAIILLIALTGALAHGPLSKRTVADGGLSVSYERFQRVTSRERRKRKLTSTPRPYAAAAFRAATICSAVRPTSSAM